MRASSLLVACKRCFFVCSCFVLSLAGDQNRLAIGALLNSYFTVIIWAEVRSTP